jgi:hypothetical protein
VGFADSCLPLGNVAAAKIMCNSGRLRPGKWISPVELQQTPEHCQMLGQVIRKTVFEYKHTP